jgi:hypothetical protein
MLKTNIKLNKSKKELTINNLIIKNPEIVNFLEDKKDLDYWVEKSIIIGCIGLKQMTLTENVDFVEKAFNQFLTEAKTSFENQTKTIDEKLKVVFDMDNSKSMISKFKEFLNEHKNDFDMNNTKSLFFKFKEFMESQNEEIDEKFEDTFSLDNKKSAFFQFKNNLDKTFDMKHKDSPLNQFRELILEYFDKKHGKLNETMQEYFDDKEGKIRHLLDGAFDIDNKKSSFSKLLKEIKENTDIEEEKIHEMLNPNKTDSPIKLLKEDLFKEFKSLKDEDINNINEKIKELKDNEIKDIRDEVLKQKNIEEEKLKGTQKGFDFEELVYEKLEEISSFYEDKILETGNVASIKGKVGDFCIDLDCDNKKRIVIECKDSKSYKGSVKKVTNEILLAIKNRNAKFGIFLFANSDQIPPSLRPIKITDSYIITSFQNENIYFAYRLARLLLLRESKQDENDIDFEKLSREFVVIEDKIETISNMQSQASKIINSGNYIHQNLGTLKSDVEISLERIKAILGDNLDDNIDLEQNDDEYDSDNISQEEDEDIKVQEEVKTNESEKICPICKTHFQSKIKTKKFCSSECKDKFSKIKKNKYLKPPERILKEELEDKGLL